MATHSSILAWIISWTEEPCGLQSTGSQRVGHDWVTNTYLLLLTSWLLNPITFFSVFIFHELCLLSDITEHFLFPECSPLLDCFLWFLVPQPTTEICCSRDSILDPGPFSYCVPSLGDPIHCLSFHYHSDVNHFLFTYLLIWASRVVLVVRNLPANAEDMGLIPGLGRFPPLLIEKWT